MADFYKLIIDNFQAHDHTEIDFALGLNVLVGPSDSGKSAVLRALRWVLFNQPRGMDFIQVGSSKCRVQLILTDGIKITRVRSNRVNRYLLTDAAGKEQIFEGFGNAVPEEVIKAHGMRAIKLADQEHLINFGMQLDPPFMVADSPGGKAKLIGAISGAEVFDYAFKDATQDRTVALTQLKEIERKGVELSQLIAGYKDLTTFEQKVVCAEALYNNVQLKVVLQQKIRTQQERLLLFNKDKLILIQQIKEKKEFLHFTPLIEQMQSKALAYKNLIKLRKALDAAREEKSKVEQQTYKCNIILQEKDRIINTQERNDVVTTLKKIRISWHSVTKERNYITKVLSKRQDLASVEKIVSKLNEYGQQLKMLNLLRKKQVYNLERLTKGRNFYKLRKKELQQTEQQYVNLLNELQECPLCGTNLSKTDKIKLNY
ncbi:MAG: hypothetical protein RLZ12_29 [Bacillota bacterium]|jgi:DNA repair exonuclease SbcCD ATPase subunit